MADIAKEVAGQVPRGANSAPVPSSFCTAIDTVQLAETFSSIATSLRKTRASLVNPTAPTHNRSRASSSTLLM
ncbi:hypothetical protein FRC01_011817 [Tulasnella sp. 417]|nr:hypothetical protein FRC01_011817 [Tulasnella sp. 417]